MDLGAPAYEIQTALIADETHRAMRAIEDKGVGIARLRSYGRDLAAAHLHNESFSVIPDVPLDPQQRNKIRKLVAAWADGDAIAAHIGFRNDVFCTEDEAKGALKPSVMDKRHREWLGQEFGVRFVSLKELAEQLETQRAA